MALAACLLLLPLPRQLRAQVLETGTINFGPIVEEHSNFVRFGSDGGMETYYALTVESSRWYARLLLAPTKLHVWSTETTEFTGGGGNTGKNSDPRVSRWHYRPVGQPRDDFVWSELTGGRVLARGPVSARVGGGIIQLSQTSHQLWGARVGWAPKAEAAVSASYRVVGLTCQGSLGRLGTVLGRWVVLEHLAGSPAPGRRGHWLTPVACGIRLSIPTSAAELSSGG